MNSLTQLPPPFFLFVLGLLMYACSGETQNQTAHLAKSEATKAIQLTSTTEASAPYLTLNHKKQPVLCWTEKLSDKEGAILKYAEFDPTTASFDKPVIVLPSKGTRAHAEGMNKVAFKADGTAVALFGVKHPVEDNPFASSIFHTLSSDGGKSWTKANYLHTDTMPIYGRSFFDLAPLPNGEIGAIWLDGRFAEADTGSALFFAQTTKGQGFGANKQIGESTCECCRTDLFVDQNGRIHVAYRDITFPFHLMGKQVRDMSYSYSDDGGKSFTKAQKLSKDDWAVDGCPHTGPSLAVNKEGVHALWFTAGGTPGVYYTKSQSKRNSFIARELISKEAKHPQLLTIDNKKLVMVWDEASSSPTPQLAGLTASHGDGAMHGGQSTNSKIMLSIKESGKASKAIPISDPDTGNATHPVIIAIDNTKVLVAWTREDKEKISVYYKVITL